MIFGKLGWEEVGELLLKVLVDDYWQVCLCVVWVFGCLCYCLVWEVLEVLFGYFIGNLCKEVVLVFGELVDLVLVQVLWVVEGDGDFEVCKVVCIVLV